MKKVLLCEPNISEGRDHIRIERVVDEVRAAPGVRLLDASSDPDHNRSVLTYLGEPEAVLEASKAMVVRALELIDMRQHHGHHPRQGAVDVAPFIPIRGVETPEAVEIARLVAEGKGPLTQDSIKVPLWWSPEATFGPDSPGGALTDRLGAHTREK